MTDGVKVKVGNVDPYFYACIRYETTSTTGVNVGLIVGIVVGVGVPVIVLIIIVIVSICKRRRTEKPTSDDDDSNKDVEMAPVVAKRPPLVDTRHVEWSVTFRSHDQLF